LIEETEPAPGVRTGLEDVAPGALIAGGRLGLGAGGGGFLAVAPSVTDARGRAAVAERREAADSAGEITDARAAVGVGFVLDDGSAGLVIVVGAFAVAGASDPLRACPLVGVGLELFRVGVLVGGALEPIVEAAKVCFLAAAAVVVVVMMGVVEDAGTGLGAEVEDVVVGLVV